MKISKSEEDRLKSIRIQAYAEGKTNSHGADVLEEDIKILEAAIAQRRIVIENLKARAAGLQQALTEKRRSQGTLD